MIKHIVMFSLHDQALGASRSENARNIKNMLDLLPGKIDDIRDYEVGINIIDSDRSMDIVIVSSFDDLDALNRYSAHPEHLKALEYLLPRRSVTKVVDYEI